MIITCEECKTRFNLEEGLLSYTGSKVRCSICKNIFTAYPPLLYDKMEQTVQSISDEPESVTQEKISEEPENQENIESLESEKQEIDQDDVSDEPEIPVEVISEKEAETETPDDSYKYETDQPELDEPESVTQEKISEEPENQENIESVELEKQEIDQDDVSDEPEIPVEVISEKETGSDKPDDSYKYETDQPEPEHEIDESESATQEKISEEPENQENIESVELEKQEIDQDDVSDEPEIPVEVISEKETGSDKPDDSYKYETDQPEPKHEIDESESATQEKISEEPEIQENIESVELEKQEIDHDDVSDEPEIPVEVISEKEAETETPDDSYKYETDQPEPKHEIDEPESVTQEKISEEPENQENIESLELEKQEIHETYDEPEHIELTIDSTEESADRKKINKKLIILAILVFMIGGLYGAYIILKDMNIRTPYVSDILKKETVDVIDSGKLKINIFDINGRFVENKVIGKIFVITGKVRNDYPESRSYIKVTGKLFKKQRVFSKEKSVSCGNVVSDSDLKNMNKETLEKILNNPSGDKDSNLNVQSGSTIPFMIVFFDLPEDLDEYVVQPVSSFTNM